MDMKTIKTKLETGEYKDPSEFEKDIKLMLANCFMYNPIGDPINKIGHRFQEVFEKKWADIGDPTSRSSSVAPSAANTTTSMTATPKPLKQIAVKDSKKEIKVELNGSKSEDIMQLNNALSMVREREEKLRAELEAITAIKEKLISAKGRHEENSNEPFPNKLITEARNMCTAQSSVLPISGITSYKVFRLCKNSSANCIR